MSLVLIAPFKTHFCNKIGHKQALALLKIENCELSLFNWDWWRNWPDRKSDFPMVARAGISVRRLRGPRQAVCKGFWRHIRKEADDRQDILLPRRGERPCKR